MHLKKNVMGLEVRAFKNCNKWTPAYKDYRKGKSLFIINSHTPKEYQSNQDKNTPSI